MQVIADTLTRLLGVPPDLPEFIYCPLLNESTCAPLTESLQKLQPVPVLLVNTLSHARTELVCLPLPSPTSAATVYDGSAVRVPSQTLVTASAPPGGSVCFEPTLSPLSVSTYFVDPSPLPPHATTTIPDGALRTATDGGGPAPSHATDDAPAERGVQAAPLAALENDNVRAEFDQIGALRSLTDKRTNTTVRRCARTRAHAHMRACACACARVCGTLSARLVRVTRAATDFHTG